MIVPHKSWPGTSTLTVLIIASGGRWFPSFFKGAFVLHFFLSIVVFPEALYCFPVLCPYTPMALSVLKLTILPCVVDSFQPSPKCGRNAVMARIFFYWVKKNSEPFKLILLSFDTSLVASLIFWNKEFFSGRPSSHYLSC